MDNLVNFGDDFNKALDRALKILRVRDRSVCELAGWLKNIGCSPGLVDRVIRRLAELRFLDDRRLAMARARILGLQRGYGPKKLADDLHRRGIDSELIRETVNKIYDEHVIVSLMRNAVQRRFKMLEGGVNADAPLKSKIQRYLLGRGFEPEDVWKFIKEEN